VSVPLFVNEKALGAVRAEIAERQRRVLESGRYILGPEVSAFEGAFASYLGAGHCVGVANGTEAITIALRALGVGPGDEVIVPGATFYATPEAVINAGAVPVFCDVDPDTWVMTAATAEPHVTERTRAILPVHLFGNPAPMDGLRELASARSLLLLEDAAQAHGARYGAAFAGTLGDAATFSFYPGKNLGATGDAGAIVSSNDDVAALARRLRFHGSEDKIVHTEVGYNSRLDEMQAAGLAASLGHLDTWTASRRAAIAA